MSSQSASIKKTEQLIACRPEFYLTVKQYKKLRSDLFVSALFDQLSDCEKIVAEVLKSGEHRFNELIGKVQNANPDPSKKG